MCPPNEAFEESAVKRIVGEEAIDQVIPNNDFEVPAVSAARDRLGTRTYLPAHETIGPCQDKLALTRHLSTPWTRQRRSLPAWVRALNAFNNADLYCNSAD